MRVSQKNLEDNLIEKKILIEKLKELLITDGSINSKYNEFKKIQNSWIKTGQVPRSQNVIIWNNYQHHIKNFYDYLHLNRKFKEICQASRCKKGSISCNSIQYPTCH